MWYMRGVCVVYEGYVSYTRIMCGIRVIKRIMCGIREGSVWYTSDREDDVWYTRVIMCGIREGYAVLPFLRYGY